MEQGLRVVGTVEFGGLDNPLSKSRINNLINNAKYMFGDLPDHEDEWLGFRPSLPDFLPVMGPSKNHKNVFLIKIRRPLPIRGHLAVRTTPPPHPLPPPGDKLICPRQ